MSVAQSETLSQDRNSASVAQSERLSQAPHMVSVTIGIAIPCYKYHLPNLRRLLESIDAQSRKPDQVVVSCSSLDQASDSAIDHGIDCNAYSYPLRIITTTERKNAAENRNRAAAALTTTIVSFFDADDVMVPHRLKYIEHAFLNYPCLIVLHNYSEGGSVVSAVPDQALPHVHPMCEYGKLRRSHTGCATHTDSYSIPIHHSQASVVATVLSKIKYREDVSSERKEDALFCGDVLEYVGTANVYIANQLSIYYPEGAWY
jgi:hypothetical protein